jgi:NADH-quinone oxidoreductase subunit J
MGPATLVFWIASIAALVGGLGVVTFKEPIRNVLSLVVVMLSLAVLFLLLSAQFVFVVQVIVYAGAVMVLFLFVITLLGPVREQGTVRLPWQVFISALVIAGFAGFLVAMLRGVTYRAPDTPDPLLPPFGSVQAIGIGLFTDYLFPFELTSILLLVAAVGAIYLSRGPREGDR